MVLDIWNLDGNHPGPQDSSGKYKFFLGAPLLEMSESWWWRLVWGSRGSSKMELLLQGAGEPRNFYHQNLGDMIQFD